MPLAVARLPDRGRHGLIVLAAGALLLAGCRSRPLGPYVSPRVTGQVLAADTGKPLAQVWVKRGKPEPPPLAGWNPKGGELLMQKPPVLTGPNGGFILPSERVLSVIRGSGWNRVRLSFLRAGYMPFQTNYPALQATNSPSGEPVLDIGKVRLVPQPPNRR